MLNQSDIFAIVIGYDFFVNSKMTFDEEDENGFTSELKFGRYLYYQHCSPMKPYINRFQEVVQKIYRFTWPFIVGSLAYYTTKVAAEIFFDSNGRFILSKKIMEIVGKK